MSIGLVGRKVGMTRIFTENGASVPVTVLEMSNNRVTQVRTPENDGYSAVQLAYGSRRNSRVNKSQAGHFAKAGVDAGEGLVQRGGRAFRQRQHRHGRTLAAVDDRP